MEAVKRTLTLLIAFSIVAFGAAVAQNDQAGTNTVGGEEFVPVGDIDVGEAEPFDSDTEEVDVEIETGALIFTGSTPDDQHPNVDLVGPNGYYEHFDFDDDPGEELVIDDLLPGVYSIAATDENLQLAHSLVEVTAGEATRVRVNLDRALADFEAGAFADDGLDDRFVFPNNAFRFGNRTAIDDNDFGAVAVETENEDAQFVVTGPNGYSREFTGTFDAKDLLPGIYTIAGTAPGSQIATSTFEVEVSTATQMVPVFEVTAETERVDQDVAGGGQAEEGQPEDVDVDVDESADEADEDEQQ